MADQHKYTTPLQVIENAARVSSIVIEPNADPTNGVERLGSIDVHFDIGLESGGVFTRTQTKTLRKHFYELGAQLQATLDDLEDRALTAGESLGVFPDGDSEPIP